MSEPITAVKSLELLNVSEEWKKISDEYESQRNEIGNDTLAFYQEVQDNPCLEKKFNEKHKAAMQRAMLMLLKTKVDEISESFAEAKEELKKFIDARIENIEEYVKFAYPSAENFYLEAVYDEVGLKSCASSFMKTLQNLPKEVAGTLRKPKKEDSSLPEEDPETENDDPYKEEVSEGAGE